jgi:UDP-N-acetyl-D-mannosaminuronic acid dehydrogenase
LSFSLSETKFGVPEQMADVCVVGGGGHVGFPLALLLANKGRRVIIHDINEEVLASIAEGDVPYFEKGAEPLLRQALRDDLLLFSTDPASVAKAPIIIVTIGTPVDEFMNPVLRVIGDCMDDLLPYLSDDHLVVLRSTVYPGTTQWLDNYLQSRDKHVRIAFCPERVVQGLAIEEISKYPQIVSGTTPEAECAAEELFGLIVPEVVCLTPMEAEFAKLFSNAYRYVHFAVANQFYMMASSAGVDYYRVLEGLKKDYPRAKDLPKAGFASGPCLVKDTMQLAAFFNNQFSLGHAAMLVNEGMAYYVVDRIAQKYDLAQASVGLLGMAFKADSDDTRASLSYKLKKILKFRAKEVLTTDPHVNTDPELMSLEEVLEKSDILVICVPHTAYSNLDTGDTPVLDVWNHLKNGMLI